MGAVERQEDVLDRPFGAIDTDHLAADRQLPADHPEVDSLPLGQCADIGATLEQHLRCLGTLTGQDRVGSRLDDAGLLGGDLSDSGAK
jgi:hypothetical protein